MEEQIMELVYLWVNNCKDCIKNQEMNFSPSFHFKVDDKLYPHNIEYYNTQPSINIMKNGIVSNITAIVGSNGAGKTSLLSFLANENCSARVTNRKGYEKYDDCRYERGKSIFIFFDNNKFIIYHNLENELKCINFQKSHHIFHNKNTPQSIPMLCEIRKQIIIYLSNSSFIPEIFLPYSQSGGTYNVNLHLKSLYLISNRFYNSLWGISEFNKADMDSKGFAGIIQNKRNEQTFQELLDILYYNYLESNKITDYVGRLKEEVYVYFENIMSLCDTTYNDDIESLKYKNSSQYEFEGKPDIRFHFKSSKKYYNKQKIFFQKYAYTAIEDLCRKNATVVLYFNLLFELFFYEDNFILPDLDFEKNIYTQLSDLLKQYEEYRNYLEDIKQIDEVLSEYSTFKNNIDNPHDLACRYDKVVNRSNAKFYSFIANIFSEGESYALRYIRIRNLEMSSGERAMQNMFSWLVLIPQLDRIMSINRDSYTSKLLLIDEIDLYSHPEWQRKIIAQLISTINKLEKNPVQIILTSHSPIILSDFPQNNTIYLHKMDGKDTIILGEKHKPTLGANIYTLFNDAFFLEKGAVGEYASKTILDIYHELKSDTSLQHELAYYENFIELIGDEILKNEMRKVLRDNLETHRYDKN